MHPGRALAAGGLPVLAILMTGGVAAGSGPTPRKDVRVSGSVRVAGRRYDGTVSFRDIGHHTLHQVGVRLTLGTGAGHRTVLRTRLRTLAPGRLLHLHVHGRVPAGLPAGRLAIQACAGWPVACATAGHLRAITPSRTTTTTSKTSTTSHSTTTGSGHASTTTTTTSSSSTATRTSTVPTAPIAYSVDTPQEVRASGGVDYWVDVPKKYDATNRTPMKLFVWLHGCGGEASGDIWEVTPSESRDYLAIADAEREDGCWDVNSDSAKVLADIADVERHFNVDPRQIILGGYSSGGDLAYRMMFYNSTFFAGLLAENTTPFRDTGSTAQQSLAAASRKFPVVHLAHNQDTTYPLQTVQNEIGQMRSAGFTVTLLTQPGDHYDNPGQHGYNGTDPDLATYLLPHIDDGWLAPGG